MEKKKNFKVRLGVFVVIGVALFVGGIYYIGKNQNLFGKSIRLNGVFNNVGGLQVGNNVRFSGINVGTVDDIHIISDTSVMVELLIDDEVRRFIKRDANAIIGSEGLMGNKVINIMPGSPGQKPIENHDTLITVKPLEIDEILKNVNATVTNTQTLTGDLAYLTTNIRNGKGMVGKLFSDTSFAKNIDKTIVNLRKGTRGFSDNMEAAKESFLLKPLFKKKKKRGEDKQEKDTSNTDSKKDRKK